MKTLGTATSALAAAISLTLGGCHTLSHYPDQPPIISGGSVEKSQVRFHVVGDLDELQAKCMNRNPNFIYYACAYPYIDPVNPKKSVCTVFVMPPKGADDSTMIAILGHEVWHCFGARHLDTHVASWR